MLGQTVGFEESTNGSPHVNEEASSRLNGPPARLCGPSRVEVSVAETGV